MVYRAIPYKWSLSWRPILVGSIIILLIAYLCPIIEQYEWDIDYTIPAPSVSVMFFFFIIVMLNTAHYKLARRYALGPSELMIIYAMTMVGAPLCSFGLVQFLIPNMVGPIRFATEENMWQEDFLHFLPNWFGPREKGVIEGFYSGDVNSVPWKAWIKPLFIWYAFALVFCFVLFCISAIIRKQWVERERLTFRILETPLAMAGEPEENMVLNRFFRNKSNMDRFYNTHIYTTIRWLTSTHSKFSVPKNNAYKNRTILYRKAWNAIDYLHISVMYSIIGIAYMVPKEISFSLWFFYLFRKFGDVFASVMGWHGGKAGGISTIFPDVEDQAVGAFLFRYS